jgi:hypothetical protein
MKINPRSPMAKSWDDFYESARYNKALDKHLSEES